MSSSALMTEEEVEALTRSEKEPIIELPVAPATMRPALVPALSAEVWRLTLQLQPCVTRTRWLTWCRRSSHPPQPLQLGALMTTALNTAIDQDSGAEVRRNTARHAAPTVARMRLLLRTAVPRPQILLSAVLPHAYQLEVGPVFKVRADAAWPAGMRMPLCSPCEMRLPMSRRS
jgi:hypothetical protein